jgi:tRNA(Ile)-lysidine synthase
MSNITLDKTLYKLNENIRNRHLLTPNSHILIAISGGQDSIVLLFLLNILQKKWNWKIGIVYCDHQTRLDSCQNARHMCAIAEELNLNYYHLVSTKQIVTEEQARSWRYKALKKIAHEYYYTILITAHTASDRSETIFFNLLRGTGTSGLKGLSWRRKIDSQLVLIRPLLNFTRREVTKILKQECLPLWPDYTNKCFSFSRNRLRNSIFPLLRRFFNPNMEKSLLQFAELISEEDSFLNIVVERILPKISFVYKKNRALNLTLLHSCPLSIQRRILRKFFLHEHDLILNFNEIEKIRLVSLNQKKVLSLFLQKRVMVKIKTGLLITKKMNWDARDSNPELVG